MCYAVQAGGGRGGGGEIVLCCGLVLKKVDQWK